MNIRSSLFFSLIGSCFVLLVGACGRLTPTLVSEATPTDKPPATATSTPLPAPVIASYAPARGEELPLAGPIEIYFDQPMDTASVEAVFAIRSSGPWHLEWPDLSTLRIIPDVALTPATTYTITITDEARSASGVPLLETTIVEVKTTGYLSVTRVLPPDQQQDVDPHAPLTVMFNHAIAPLGAEFLDPQTLPQPLIFEPPAAGQGRWLNTSTYQFQPDPALASGITYTVRVPVTLTDASGAGLQQAYAWAFTTPRPAITSTFPQRDAINVPLTTSVTITFNQPMNPASVEAAFSLTLAPNDRARVPGLPGQFTWNVEQTALTFTPQAPLEFAQRMFVTLYQETYSASGVALAPGFEFSFGTRAASVVRTTPTANAVNVPLTATLRVMFDQPMERTSVENDFLLIDGLTGDYLTGRFTWNTDQTEFTFQPDRRLPVGAPLTGALSTDSHTLTDSIPLLYNRAFNFVAVGPPKVSSTSPDTGDIWPTSEYPLEAFRAYFVAPINPNSLAGQVAITPPLANLKRIYTDDRSHELKLEGAFSPSTMYTVTLGAGIADNFGNTLGQTVVVTFTTGELLPKLQLYTGGRDIATYSAGIDPKVYVLYCNLDHIDVALYRLTPTDLLNHPVTAQPSALLRQWTEPVRAQADGLLELTVNAGTGPLEPGLYLLQVQPPTTDPNALARLQHILAVADVNLTVKSTFDEVLVWATDYATGQPSANRNVQVYDRNTLKRVGSGTTDEKGLWRFALPERLNHIPDYMAVADEAGTYGLTVSGWSSGVASGSATTADRYRTYLYSDRPIYRPGQTVLLKGLTRIEADARYTLPDVVTATLSIFDIERRQTIFSTTVSFNDAGSFEAKLPLPEGVATGLYAVGLSNGLSPTSLRFRVEEYRKPEYQVMITPTPAEVIVNEAITLTVHTGLFFGVPVPEASVAWQLVDPNPPNPSFDDEPDVWRDGQGVTDANGDFTQVLTPTRAGAFLFNVLVTDLSGLPVTAQSALTVRPAALAVKVRVNRPVVNAGDAIPVEITTTDWQGEPVSAQPVELVVVKSEWLTETLHETEIRRLTLTTDAEGQAAATYTPPTGGRYILRVTTSDTAGRAATANVGQWVVAPEAVNWGQSPKDTRLELIANQAHYRPGDVATILIPSPFAEPVSALVTIERGQIFFAEVIRLESASTVYSLPVTADYAPNVFVNVMLVHGPDRLSPLPTFRSGALNLSVSVEQQALTVTLTPDREVVRPGDTVVYTITAHDYLSRPVRAEFSVALTDLAALALAKPNSPPMLEAFYGQRALGVRTATGLAAERNTLGPPNDRLWCYSGGGQGGGGDQRVPIGVRSNFLDTAFWEAFVVTDENGCATVTITLPDNVTTWRLDARGATTDTLVGQSAVDIVAVKPLLIRPETPRFFVVGDKVDLAAIINNNTDADVTATVALSGTGVTLPETTSHTLTIPAHGAARVEWPVRVEETDAADLVFSVQGGGYADASKPPLGQPPTQTIPIYRYVAPDTVGTAGEVPGGESRTEIVSLPRGLNTTRGQLDIQVDPSLVVALGSGLRALEQAPQPYACVEQAVSGFLPAVVTYQALQQLGQADLEMSLALTESVTMAMAELEAQQRSDGGWGWCPSHQRSHPLTTAYVAFGLYHAREVGFAVSGNLLERAANYLVRQVQAPEQVKPIGELNRQAFILYVLALLERATDEQLLALYQDHARLDFYARAYLVLALHHHRPNASETRTLLTELEYAALTTATGEHWVETWNDTGNMNSDVRSTAIILTAFVKTQPRYPGLPQVVRWLMSTRQADGGWATSQETVWSLIALTDWLTTSGELDASYTYAIHVNDTQAMETTVTPSTGLTNQTLTVALADLFTEHANRLRFVRGAGDGRLYYTAHLTLYQPVATLVPITRGISIARQYSSQEGECGPVEQPRCPAITSAQVGDTVQVRLTIVVPNDLYYVVIEDAIPAGAEVLLNSLTVGAASRFSYYDEWERWRFISEARDEKVALFAEYLPAGTYEYTYALYLTHSGQYNVIPPVAQELYFPEVYGRGSGVSFTIEP